MTAYFSDYQSSFGLGLEQVTLHHLLTMTSGMEWEQWAVPYGDPSNDETIMDEAPDPVAMVLSRSVKSPPGTSWTYNSGSTELLAEIVERESGMPLTQLAEEALFGPLGIRDYEWFGPTQWQPPGRPAASWGLRLRGRDVAKIGSLMLHEGRWGGRQVVPAAWVARSIQKHVTEMPRGFGGRYGYGYQWWVGRSRSFPPYTIVAAMGYGGQRAFVVPERHLVVTVLAGNYGVKNRDGSDRILARVTGAHKSHS